MIDGSRLPLDRRSSFPRAYIDLTDLLWISWTGSSLGLCPEEGDVGFDRLRSHMVNTLPCCVKPPKEVGETTSVGAERVGRPPTLKQMQGKFINGGHWSTIWSN